MSWETHNKEETITKAKVLLAEGKLSSIIREQLLNEGLTVPEANEVMAELSGKPTASADHANTLGTMASETLQREDTPRGIAADLWNKGKSKIYISNHLADRGFSNEEIGEALRGLGGSSRTGSINNYGSLGKEKHGQQSYQAPSSGSSGSSQIAIGLVLMIGGCAFTYFSYTSAANSPTGGTYYITYGPIIFGAWMLFKGLMNSD